MSQRNVHGSQQSRAEHDQFARLIGPQSSPEWQSLVLTPGARAAGLLVPAASLRRDGDHGIGDTQAVIEAIEFCNINSLKILQLLPINATNGDNSPYNAISSFALEPALITLDPDKVPGLTGWIMETFIPEELRQSLSGSEIDYESVKKIKREVLYASFQNFREGDYADETPLAREFHDFIERKGAKLKEYALFRSIADLHQGDARWWQWEEKFREPHSARSCFHDLAPDDPKKDLPFFHTYVQFVAARQWADVRNFADKSGVELMGDIPFGVGRQSADVWADRAQFDLAWSIGAPPEDAFGGDPFTENWGQNWGPPGYNWPYMERTNYQWWRGRVSEANEIFHSVRIDHAFGFFRYYGFPWESERNGEFATLTPEMAASKTGGLLPRFHPFADDTEEHIEANGERATQILKVLLEEGRGCGIVAEDLGHPHPVKLRDVLSELKIPGYWIPFWHKDTAGEYVRPGDIPELTKVVYGTHDHSPLKQFWQSKVDRWQHAEHGHHGWQEIQRIVRFLGESDSWEPPHVLNRPLHKLFADALLRSNARVAVFNLPDLFATGERWNAPSQNGLGNWTRRTEVTLADANHESRYKETLSDLRELIIASKRFGFDD